MIRKLLIAWAIFTALSAPAQTRKSEISNILKAAKAQIGSFIRDLPDEDLADYGFTNKQEFVKIQFDDPIPVYTLKDSTMVFTSTWRVPLVISKEIRSLLTVIRENGVYQAVDFGATELAQAYAANKTPKTIGMLRVYELRSDYLIEKPENGSQMLIQLEFNK
jgi:hypothetical protein